MYPDSARLKLETVLTDKLSEARQVTGGQTSRGRSDKKRAARQVEGGQTSRGRPDK
jgi:hypothetical protein